MTSERIEKVKFIKGGLWMDNNDILIRLRYAIDINDIEMVERYKTWGRFV